MEAVERALAAGIQNKKRTPCLCVYLYAGANINAKDAYTSSIDLYNNDVGKRFMKVKGTLTSATLYFT